MTRVAAFLMLLTYLITGCGGTPPDAKEIERQAFDDLREEVRLVIDDSAREAAVVAIVDQLEVDFATVRQLAEERRARLRDLNSNYDATREQFEALLAEFRQRREDDHARFRETRHALREATSPEEWDRLKKVSTKAMATLAKQIGSI